MNQLKPDYKFYATLLDAYKWYQVSESDTALQELIDKINRVPFESDAAAKGTAFNYLIDSTLIGYDKFGEQITKFDSFEFDTNLVKEISQSLTGAIPQYFTSTVVNTSKGLVEIYGYIDYILHDKAIDLKCTGSYDLGKFKGSMQRHVYPVCLAQEGIFVDEFEFLVTDYKGIFRESYKVNLEESEREIINVCESLIDFLEIKKDQITDEKVFGGPSVILAEYDCDVKATIID